MGDLFIDIPDELLMDILSRLPVKSILRFNCVSNKWHWLISNILRNIPKILMCSPLSMDGQLLFHSIDSKTQTESVCIPRELEIIVKTKLKERQSRFPYSKNLIVKIHSSCGGFLLIQVENDLFLWGPQTSIFIHVLTFDRFNLENDRWYFVADLCFDYFTHEYKVMLVEKYTIFTDNIDHFYIAACGTDSWQSLYFPDAIHGMFPGPIFKGYRHWISRGRMPTFENDNSFIHAPTLIVYFDPRTNMFMEVPRPLPKEGKIDHFLDLGVLNGYLCVTRWDDITNSRGNIELLVRREHGNNLLSWEIMFVMSNTPELRSYGNVVPLFITKEGEILMRVDIGYEVWTVKAYDIHGNFLRNIYNGFGKVILFEEISPIRFS